MGERLLIFKVGDFEQNFQGNVTACELLTFKRIDTVSPWVCYGTIFCILYKSFSILDLEYFVKLKTTAYNRFN